MNKFLSIVIALIVVSGCSHSGENHKGESPKGLFGLGMPAAANHKKPHGKATKHAHHHSHHGALRHDFSDAQKWAKMFDDPQRDLWQKPTEVTSHMKISKGMVVADVGAGTGYFLPHLDRAVGQKGRVLALDVEPNLVDHMKKRIHRQKLKSTVAQTIAMSDPNLDAQSVDRVLIVDTWHHIENRKDYSEKLKKALKSGGQVVIVDFEPNAKGPGPSRKHRLSSNSVAKELAASGLKTKVLKETLPHQYIVVGFK